MITIDKETFVRDIDEYGRLYGRKLESLLKTAAFIDTSYLKTTLRELDTFAPAIRKNCMNDITMLHQDISGATNLQDAYDSFGEYCYEMLKSGFSASNLCLQENNKLASDIHKIFGFEASDIAISSDFIGFNTFSKHSRLILTNFRVINGRGLLYNVNFDGGGRVNTNNIREFNQSEFVNLIEMSSVIEEIQNEESELNRLFEDWAKKLNVLSERKEHSRLAWYSMYKAYRDNWGEVHLRKQIKDVYCTMIIKDKHCHEVLHRSGKNNTVDWGTDTSIIPVLDYLNQSNFEFTEDA